MKYTFILFFYITFFSTAFSQKTERDSIILWSKNRKLKWSDFKGIVKDSISKEMANCFTKIEMTPYFSDKNTYSYKVFAFFYVNKSISSKIKSNELLKHEQLHFDICELYARKIRKKILEQESSVTNVDYSKIYNDLFFEYKNYQMFYDFETAHSSIKGKQKQWEEKVSKELEELREFDISIDGNGTE